MPWISLRGMNKKFTADGVFAVTRSDYDFFTRHSLIIFALK